MLVTFWGHEFKVNIVVACIGGFLIAIVSSMFGFGGGPFMVPLMTVVLRSADVCRGRQLAAGDLLQHPDGNGPALPVRQLRPDVLSHHVSGRDPGRLHRAA
ncbi:MAG: hypothetical protein MZV70_39610 [Desulfobacterales bacterium]|nr:hypothetical protein [Desulfobacterales bacterium]